MDLEDGVTETIGQTGRRQESSWGSWGERDGGEGTGWCVSVYSVLGDKDLDYPWTVSLSWFGR